MHATNHKPTKRRNITRWMQNRQRRLFWKNKTHREIHLAERIDQLGKQIVANVAIRHGEDGSRQTRET